jgi:uncharacterized membrane protein YoaK (UPF0700 family)
MIRYDRPFRAVAVALTTVAGFVDAVGYLNLSGLFVSFMSGNSTQMAVAVARKDWRIAVLAASLTGLFLTGVIVGSLVGSVFNAHRRAAVLLFVTCLLLAATAFGVVDRPRTAIATVTMAMGAENAVFERDGEVVGLTYMTGTLVKLGQRLGAALRGGDRWAWISYLISWTGLVCGAALGALAYLRFGLGALGFAALVMAIMTGVVIHLDRRDTG